MNFVQTSKLRKAWLIFGSLLFGGYASWGLFYFETFGPGQGKLWFWPLAGLAIGLISLATAWWLFAGQKRKAFTQALAGMGLFCLATLSIWLLGNISLDASLSWDQLQRIGFHLLLVGLLPCMAALLLVPNSSPVAEIPVAAPKPSEERGEPLPNNLQIHSSSGELALQVQMENLICIEAADNYCKFQYMQEGQRKTKIVRTSMKAVEELLEGLHDFHRCHRSFIINAHYIQKLEGPSQAQRLVLKHLDDPIPVSRSFNPQSIPQIAEMD